MVPYMGLLHTALGDELAEFMQGQESAKQALADVTRAYNTAAKEGGFLAELRELAQRHHPPRSSRPSDPPCHDGSRRMPHRTFLAFIAPSLFVMILFIALPIVSVAYQSLYVEHEQVLRR